MTSLVKADDDESDQNQLNTLLPGSSLLGLFPPHFQSPLIPKVFCLFCGDFQLSWVFLVLFVSPLYLGGFFILLVSAYSHSTLATLPTNCTLCNRKAHTAPKGAKHRTQYTSAAYTLHTVSCVLGLYTVHSELYCTLYG